ncbi:MAG: tripartite tricarboxylate transporter TctB family protein [Alphaproteobacteria bacterium]|nr:tripartite tricarboxylate transporter TctB family protein [Alphaproteobacteria bacterium]
MSTRLGARTIGPVTVLGALAVFAAIEASRYGIGSLNAPGPGFFPFWLATLLGLCATAVLIGAPRSPPPVMDPGVVPFGWMRSMGALALLGCYAVLLERVGYVGTTALVLAPLFRIGGVRWLVAAPLGLLVGIASWALFDALALRLPVGVWWR